MDENLISMVDILCLILVRNSFVKRVVWQGTLSYKCILNEVFGIPCCLQQSFRPVFPRLNRARALCMSAGCHVPYFVLGIKTLKKNLTLNYL
jgi:hypothetical protein